MIIKKVHINNIVAGDTILHLGKVKTVCKDNIKYCKFMGTTIFGDSYKLGQQKVLKVILRR